MLCKQVGVSYPRPPPSSDIHDYVLSAGVVFCETKAKFVDLQLHYTALRPAVRVEFSFIFVTGGKFEQITVFHGTVRGMGFAVSWQYRCVIVLCQSAVLCLASLRSEGLISAWPVPTEK